MNREQIIAKIRAHESELRTVGVLSLSLFGSASRGDSGIDSDIDVAVRLGKDFSQPGFDYFKRLNELQARLTQVLGCNVDVIEEPVHKKRLQESIDMDRTLAF